MSTVWLQALRGGSPVASAAGTAMLWLAVLGAVGWLVGSVADATIVESVRRRLEDELAARREKGISKDAPR